MDEILPLIDFRKVKKKARDKPINLKNSEESEEENEKKNSIEENEKRNSLEEEDLEDVIISKNPKKKKKKDEKKSEKKSEKISGGTDNKLYASIKLLYDYEFLLKRVTGLIKENNPDSIGEQMTIPTVKISSTKTKSCWAGFSEFPQRFNRDREHFLKFVISEFGVDVTIGQDGQANIKGRINKKQAEETIKKYIKEYVKCPMCKGFKTILERDNKTRFLVIKCETCKATKTLGNLAKRVKAGKKDK